MNEMLAAEKFRAAGLQKQVFAGIAAGYAGKKNVLHFAPELTPGEVRELADLIAQCCAGANVVCAGCDESGYSLCIASRDTDVRGLGKAAFDALSGRGGGKEGAVQGSVKATKAQIKAFFETAE
jgi:alanyl-tRNA synthetase